MKKRFAFKTVDSDFKKSSYTHPGGIINYCVEVAITPAGVAVRNSNDPTKRTAHFTREEWKRFVQGVHNNEFEV